MRIVLQRVSEARVHVESRLISAINEGLLLLVGIHQDDTAAQADFLAEKCCGLRVFSDNNGKMNLSVSDCGGAVLAVSQFTLFGNCAKGRRPSFIEAATPEKGRKLYDYFVEKLRERISEVKTGIFGAHMEITLVNDGPVTLLLEK